MFEKLLATLPFNPSLVDKLAFYSKRVRAEKSVRRISTLFIVLAFFVQFFAFISPPQATLAASPNDLVDGGFKSNKEAGADCTGNVKSNNGAVGYGQILANYGITCAEVANAPTVSLVSTADNKNLWSMGNLPGSDLGKVLPGQQPVNIDGQIFYIRYLWGWDSPGTTSTYYALNVTTPGGQTLFLLFACGNLVSVGPPIPIKPPPPPCKIDTSILSTNPLCVPCKYNPTIIASNPSCKAPIKPTPCTIDPSILETNPLCVPCKYNPTIIASNSKCKAPIPPCTLDSAILSTNPLCVPCEYNPTIIASSSECKPCEASLSSEDSLACVIPYKTAANLTESIANANSTTAQAGDLIQYTLYADNTGKAVVKDYPFHDDLSYVLDYSSLANAEGGTLSKGDVISWPAVNIKPNQTISVKFEVRVDNPIPQTPVSTSDPGYFNLTMSNSYGNTITIKLPPTPVAIVETATTSLPNTGPGTSLVYAAIIVAVASYFFYRSKILTEESEIAIKESVEGGL